MSPVVSTALLRIRVSITETVNAPTANKQTQRLTIIFPSGKPKRCGISPPRRAPEESTRKCYAFETYRLRESRKASLWRLRVPQVTRQSARYWLGLEAASDAFPLRRRSAQSRRESINRFRPRPSTYLQRIRGAGEWSRSDQPGSRSRRGCGGFESQRMAT